LSPQSKEERRFFEFIADLVLFWPLYLLGFGLVSLVIFIVVMVLSIPFQNCSQPKTTEELLRAQENSYIKHRKLERQSYYNLNKIQVSAAIDENLKHGKIEEAFALYEKYYLFDRDDAKAIELRKPLESGLLKLLEDIPKDDYKKRYDLYGKLHTITGNSKYNDDMRALEDKKELQILNESCPIIITKYSKGIPNRKPGEGYGPDSRYLNVSLTWKSNSNKVIKNISFKYDMPQMWIYDLESSNPLRNGKSASKTWKYLRRHYGNVWAGHISGVDIEYMDGSKTTMVNVQQCSQFAQKDK